MAKKEKVTACGVTVEIDPARLADVRVQMDIGKLARLSDMADESAKMTEMIATYSHMMESMFGDDVDKIMDKVADAHGGVLDTDTWGEFFRAVLESQTVKNS